MAVPVADRGRGLLWWSHAGRFPLDSHKKEGFPVIYYGYVLAERSSVACSRSSHATGPIGSSCLVGCQAVDHEKSKELEHSK